MAAFCRDISEQKRAERQLLELNQTLEPRVTDRTAEIERERSALARAPLVTQVTSLPGKKPFREGKHRAGIENGESMRQSL
ncbi:MAG TPA: hypothetical protein VL793_12825 [Patescibacteria group bacterium]|nr:hypothetical protein [Patescibacteria group bacterium]